MRTNVVAIRGIITLAQTMGESLGELGVRAEELAVQVFPGKVREKAAIHTQLAGLYAEALQNERITGDVIKKARSSCRRLPR